MLPSNSDENQVGMLFCYVLNFSPLKLNFSDIQALGLNEALISSPMSFMSPAKFLFNFHALKAAMQAGKNFQIRTLIFNCLTLQENHTNSLLHKTKINSPKTIRVVGLLIRRTLWKVPKWQEGKMTQCIKTLVPQLRTWVWSPEPKC